MTVTVQQMQQAVEQCEVRARLDLQVEIRFVCGRRAARIDHDQFCAGLDPVHHAQIQDRMAVGHVGADHEEQIGLVEVLIRARRTVRTQRQLVAAAGARHAQPRVRFDLVGAHKALGKLVDEVLRLDRHLPGHIEGERVGSVSVEQLAQAAAGVGKRLIDRQRDRVAMAVAPLKSAFQAPRFAQRDMRRGTLGAQPPEIGRMLAVTGDPDDLAVLDLQHHAAADTAVRAHRLDAGAAHSLIAPYLLSDAIIASTVIPRPTPGRP